MKRSFVFLFLLCVFGGILFSFNLGSWDLWNSDEPRNAQVAKEMLQDGEWVIPHLNSEVYVGNTPFFFWLTAATAEAVGGMNEFAARFPSALFGLLTLLMVFFLGMRLFKEKVGFLAALILATSVEFLWLARWASIDVTFTFFTTAAITCSYIGFSQQKGRWGFYLLAYLAMALGVITKLQMGVIVPALVVGGYFLVRREMGFFKDSSHIPGIALFIAVIGGWISLAYLSGGVGYLLGLINQKTASTFFETASYNRPLYYYLVNFPINFVPWIIFLPSALIYGLSAKGGKKEFIFVLFWFVIVLVFFSVDRVKQELTLLPLFPAAALMVAYLLAELPLGAAGADKPICSIPFFVLIICLALIAISLPITAALQGGFYLEHPWEIGLVTALIIGGCAFLAYLGHRYRRGNLPLYIVCATIFALSLYGSARIFPEINKYKSARPLAQAIVSAMRPGDQLGAYQLEGVNFIYYTGDNQMRWMEEEGKLKEFLRSPQRVLCIMHESNYKLLQQDPTITISVVATGQVGSKHLVVISNRQLS
jgi:4-amino-4-deoxy-L-arabinose transferase-like glycosyltransferase